MGRGSPPPSGGSSLSASASASAYAPGGDPYAGLDDPAVPFPYRLFATELTGPGEDGGEDGGGGESAEEAGWVDAVAGALAYDFEAQQQQQQQQRGGGGREAVPPREVLGVWTRLVRVSSASALGLDRATALGMGVLVPHASFPHPGGGGHQALFDCLFHALAASPQAMGDGGRGGMGGGGGGTGGGGGGGGGGSARDLKARVEEQMMGGAGSAAAARARSVLLLPDLIIFFAICRRYRHEATTTQLSRSEGRRYATLLASLLAFRVYDGYQKRGLVTRDTVQRFFADVHGDDSYQRPAVRRVLDALFTVEELAQADGAAGRAGAATPFSSPAKQQRERTHLSPTEFCRGVAATTTLVPGTGHQAHVLLDWVLALGNATLPGSLVPSPSMRRLIGDKMDLLALANPERAIGGLCKEYGLGQHDLYEAKRRFRSVVELAADDDGGDGDGDGDGSDSGSAIGSCSTKEEGRHLPLEENPTTSGPGGTDSGAGGPRNVIRRAAFVRAASRPNEEEGQGGYLTPALAELSFQGGWIMGNRRRRGDEEDKYWTMHDVLDFGCRAVRGDAAGSETDDPEAGLLKFAFAAFLMLRRTGASEDEDQDVDEAAEAKDAEVDGGPMAGGRGLSRAQIGQMIVLLLEHAEFRLSADSPPPGSMSLRSDDSSISSEEENDDEGSESSRDEEGNVSDEEDEWDGKGEGKKSEAFQQIEVDTAKVTTVDATAASLLGMLPPNLDASSITASGKVKISLLTDYVLDESVAEAPVGEDDGKRRPPKVLSFSGFLNWYHSRSSSCAHLPKTDRRIGPYLLDLRLLASILFGLRPSRPTLEYSLVEEVQRRHKYRFPHQGTNLRGPPGTRWFVIHVGWWRRWLDYSQGKGGAAATRLGKINNHLLLAENGSLSLRSGLRWKNDFELIPPLAWSALQAWYDGGPSIHREVVTFPSSIDPPPSSPSNPKSYSSGATAKKKQEKIPRGNHDVELFPLFVTVMFCDATSRGEARPFQQQVPLSRHKPLLVLLEALCESLDAKPELCRLWMSGKGLSTSAVGADGSSKADETPEEPPDFLLYLHMRLEEQLRSKRISIGESNRVRLTLMLEMQNAADGSWPLGVRNNLEGPSRVLNENGIEGVGDGIVGLYNMGNTCYLNSSLQCLSHTPILRDYFTTKAYLNDINAENPLGQQGRLAQVSAVLVNELWKRHGQPGTAPVLKKAFTPRTYNPVLAPALTPKSFKEAIGRFNDHFAGNEQHDAQELLAYLLDGLSEDLNRVHDKPYTEQPDSDGRSDKELADIWWSNHLKREMSIIVALFTGQYKSLLTCKACSYESARFEPFSFLTVPLPEDDQVSVQLAFCPLKNGGERVKYTVRVKHDGILSDVLDSLAKVLHADRQVEGVGEEFQAKAAGLDEDADKICEAMSKNMAVVRMKDNYIFNILPRGWSLAKMQNRDTGELDMLHVFELDPVPSEEESELGAAKEVAEEKDGSGAKDQVARPSYLAIAQRKMELCLRPFLHPYAHCLFGVPLLLRVVDLEGYTGRDLYDLVAERINPLVPKTVQSIFSRGRDVDPGEDNRAGNESPRGKKGRQHRQKTTADMEDASAGKMPRYGFRLRVSSRDGRRCALCPWYDCCIGCLIPDDDSPTIVMDGDSIVIDWHMALDIDSEGFGVKVADAQATILAPSGSSGDMTVGLKKHPTCSLKKNKYGFGGCITLEECLDAFSKEEKIPDAYCSRCQDLKEQNKMMSLWRLPPVAIIHLKRFQFTPTTRRKLRDLVVFPTEGLDLSRIVASCKGGKASAEDGPVPDGGSKGEAGETEGGKSEGGAAADVEMVGDSMSTMRLGTPEKTGGGADDSLYDLYGVVHHQGAMAGGHYVASLKSETDGKWRLFNDAQIFEVNERDVVDSSAYILFYIRRDVKSATLDEFWDTTVREGQGMSQDEMEKLMKQREKCTIS